MKIQLKRVNEAVHLEAVNDTGNVIHLDGSPEIGGENLGMRPMQLLLVALGGCSSMDVLSILRKQRQQVTDYSVDVEGERVKDGDVSLFRTIHVRFKFVGKNLDEKKVAYAIDLSMNKYCSVTKTLEPTATIVTSYELVED